MVDTKYYYYNIKQGTLQQKQQKKRLTKHCEKTGILDLYIFCLPAC